MLRNVGGEPKVKKIVNIQIGQERLKHFVQNLKLIKTNSYKGLHVYSIFRLCFHNIKIQY